MVDGMFIAIGYEPNTEFLKDIIKKDVYQLTTAVSEATVAAINVKKEINN